MAGLTFTGLCATSPAASAQTGVISKTWNLPNLQNPSSGRAKAQIRNARVTWYIDRTEGREWVTVTAQLHDSGPGDGWCARIRLVDWTTPGNEPAYAKECNGVWQTRTLSANYTHYARPSHRARVDLDLYTSSVSYGTLLHINRPW
ncbi:hypothetical protein [Nonomuraea cavernae]|uniref:hypothetical protein n=1 Tax=Nonomuraea cavernae TaxID=2045107 RepID=UPI0033F9C5F7